MLWKYSLEQIITWWTLHLCNNLLPVHNEQWPGKKEGHRVKQLTCNFLRVCFCTGFVSFDTNVNYNLVSRSELRLKKKMCHEQIFFFFTLSMSTSSVSYISAMLMWCLAAMVKRPCNQEKKIHGENEIMLKKTL